MDVSSRRLTAPSFILANHYREVFYLKRIFPVVLSLLILCSCSSPASLKSNSENISLSNKKQGWGFKKTENGPEFTNSQKELMEKYNCIYHGSPEEKVLYLTFDEGYENGYTPLILDTLKEKGVPAAFFVTGPYVKNEPELILRMAKEGHIIGNHTVNHPSVPDISGKELAHELSELDRLIFGVCKKNTKYFRPPMGEYSERTLHATTSLGYINTFWSFAYVDWNNNVSKEEAKKNILKSFHNGTVILLHAVSRGNAEALGEAIDIAKKEGYVFKSLDEYPGQR